MPSPYTHPSVIVNGVCSSVYVEDRVLHGERFEDCVFYCDCGEYGPHNTHRGQTASHAAMWEDDNPNALNDLRVRERLPK